MLVSASFLSSKNIPKDIAKLDTTDVDYIHVDVMDGKFVSNKTMPFREMKKISKYTSKRLDVHLMVLNPKKFILDYALLNTEFITIHVEAENVVDNLKLIKDCGLRCGLSIKPNTEVKELVPYLPLIDLIIVMGVEPGAGGQEFLVETEKRLEEIKALIGEYKRNILISVDGGVNNNTRGLCNDADILVAGHYITSSEDFQMQINNLR